MRRIVMVAFAAALLSISACGDDGGEPTDTETTPGEATATTQGSISTEEFCEGRGAEEIGPLTEDFVASLQTYSQSLPDLEPSDREELEALVDDVETDGQALAEAYRGIAPRLADPQVAADLMRVGDQLDEFVAALREAVLSGELGDTDPSVVLEEAFGALTRHCE